MRHKVIHPAPNEGKVCLANLTKKTRSHTQVRHNSHAHSLHCPATGMTTWTMTMPAPRPSTQFHGTRLLRGYTFVIKCIALGQVHDARPGLARARLNKINKPRRRRSRYILHYIYSHGGPAVERTNRGKIIIIIIII